MTWYFYNNRGVLEQTGPPDTMPVGLITMFQSIGSPTPSLPTGWVMCDGTVYPTATYPELAAVLAYPAAPGANFSVPDLSEFFVIGRSGSYPLNSTGGDDLHGHALNAHTHSNTHTHAVTATHVHYAHHSHKDSAHTHGNNNLRLSADSGTARYLEITGGGSTDAPKGSGSGDSHFHDITGSTGGTVGSGDSTNSTNVWSGASGNGTSGSAATTLQAAVPPLADTGTKLPPYLNTYCIIKAVDLSGQYV